jgi:hypothetical protein
MKAFGIHSMGFRKKAMIEWRRKLKEEGSLKIHGPQ